MSSAKEKKDTVTEEFEAISKKILAQAYEIREVHGHTIREDSELMKFNREAFEFLERVGIPDEFKTKS